MNVATIPLSSEEVYGPVFQGEGRDIGRPCIFVRMHRCPVKCPGCDTAHTWDGSEKGTVTPVAAVEQKIEAILRNFPACGVVFSGGEPLLHYRNGMLKDLVAKYRRQTWSALETSGFVGRDPVPAEHVRVFQSFFAAFTTVHLSPKITPCLHGAGWTDAELTVNIPNILAGMATMGVLDRLVLKFVARDDADIKAILDCDQEFGFRRKWCREIYVMPYGVERDEVLKTIEELLPACAKHGLIVTPRLHTIMYGHRRGI